MTSTIFTRGDRAIYHGMALRSGEFLSGGDIVTVIEGNEDYEDDALVMFRGSYIAVPAPDLEWIESGEVA